MYITPLCLLLVGATICLSAQNPPSDTKQHAVDNEALAKALAKALGLKKVLRPIKESKRKVPKYILDPLNKHAVDESEASGNSQAGDTSVRTSDLPCTRHDWNVSLPSLHPNIIFPEAPFNAGYCAGKCRPYRSRTLDNTAIREWSSTGPEPCCVPRRYSGKSVIYNDDKGNPVKRDFYELVVVDCQCK